MAPFTIHWLLPLQKLRRAQGHVRRRRRPGSAKDARERLAGKSDYQILIDLIIRLSDSDTTSMLTQFHHFVSDIISSLSNSKNILSRQSSVPGWKTTMREGIDSFQR